MAETAQNHPETVPPPVVTSAAEPAATATELSADETHLQSIFPDLDAAIIHDCYVLCERNVERTVEFLLSDASANVTNAPGGMSQNEIDEQLARHLEQEELSAAAAGDRRAWNPQQAPAVAPRQPTSLRSGQTAPADQGPGIEEQLNKIAETGKRTFNTIFNKVKEKLKEFDQPSQGAPSSSQSYYAPSGATVVESQSRTAPSPYQASYAPPPGPPAGTSEQRMTTAEPTANPISSNTATTATAPPSIDVSKAAFLAKKPTPLTETSKPHPEEDLTENPFDDRSH